MPWIEPKLLDCVVFLYPSEAAAEDGEKAGGSGFLVGEHIPDTGGHLISVVTNKHVINRGHAILRINTRGGGRDIIPLDQSRWYVHPNGDDIAVCPVTLDQGHKFSVLTRAQFLTREAVEEFDIGPGDDVFVVGRFVNHEGKERNLPTARFGNIAQMPWEPITIDGQPQESFLVEARSIAGYSGSPVFVHFTSQNIPLDPKLRESFDTGRLPIPGLSPKRVRLAMPLPVRFVWLLGIDWCHLGREEKITNVHTGMDSADWVVKNNTGMMGVVPAWKLLEILDGDEMKKLVDDLSAKAREEKKTEYTGDLDSSDDSNPSHREDFMRLLSAAAKGKPQGGRT
jgi:hypothetical protein